MEFAWSFSTNHSCLAVGNDMVQQVIFILGFDSHLKQCTFDKAYPILDTELVERLVILGKGLRMLMEIHMPMF